MIPRDLGKKYFPNKYYRRPLRQKPSEVNQIIRDIQRPTSAYFSFRVRQKFTLARVATGRY